MLVLVRSHMVEERVHVRRGDRVMFIAPDTVKRGDVICDQFGVALRDRKRRRGAS